MKDQIKTCLKIAWLVTAVAVFFMGTATCAANSEACVPAAKTMFWLMLLITFPTGVFASLVATILVEPTAIHDPADFTLGWIVMMFGGLLQWFVFVPNIFDAPGYISLNLKTSARSEVICSQDGPAVSGNEARKPQEVLETREIGARTNPTPTPAVSTRIPRRQRPRKLSKPIAAFDKKGRTPLERVLDRL